MSRFLNHLNPRRAARRIVLKALERFGPGDITIRHHYTGAPLLLHSFRHKGYWYYGRRREQEAMRFFRQAIKSGDQVVEVGGHIGYMTMYFSELTGTQGNVIVFEPGSNNLPYITNNTATMANVEIVPKAVSDVDGTACFFEEELTGQNNSLHRDYHIFQENCERAYTKQAYSQREIETVRLDSFWAAKSSPISLIKIDVEGAERLALNGGKEMLSKQLPVLVVEVTNQKEDVFKILREMGYWLFTDAGQPLVSSCEQFLNVCALHPQRHAELIGRLGWSRSLAA